MEILWKSWKICIWLVVSTHLKNMKVSCSPYSQLNGKIIQMFQTTNQKFVYINIYKP